MKLRKFFFLSVMTLMGVSAYAQSVIKGVVFDIDTNKPIPNVNVRIDNALRTSTTNSKGEFTIRGLKEGEYVLNLSHVAYQAKKHKAKAGNDNVRIVMEPAVNNLSQIVVTATGTHRRITDNPIPVKVITAKDIKSTNSTSLKDVLSKLTSEYTFTTSTMSSEMSLNGLNSKYVLFLINGKKTTSEDFVFRTNLANVKRIELLNSSASTLYGSDAMAGVVNIITDESKNKVDITAGQRISRKGQMDSSLDIDLNFGRFSSYTSLQRQAADSWRISDFEEEINKKTNQTKLVPTGKVMFTGYDNHNFTQRFNVDITNKLSAFAEGSYYRSMTDRPAYGVDGKSHGYDYNIMHQNYGYSAGVKYVISRGAYIEGDYSSNNYKSQYRYIKDTKKNKIDDRDTRKLVDTNRANLKGIFRLNHWNKFSVGAEYTDDKLNSNTENINDKSVYHLAAYLQDEIKITKHFEAVAGLRYVYSQTFKGYFTPSLALMYKNEGFKARASYSTGFRTPTLTELYSFSLNSRENTITIGNEKLHPEESKNFTLNLSYDHELYSVSVGAFFNNVTNMISYGVYKGKDAKQFGDYKEVKQRENINKANIKGISFNANRYLGSGFNVAGGYTLMKAIDSNSEKFLDRSFVYSANMKADWSKTFGLYSINANIIGRYISDRYNNVYSYYYPAYGLIDLNTNHTFRLKDFDLTAGLGIENLLDYKDDRPYNARKPYTAVTPGRTLYANFVIRFRK